MVKLALKSLLAMIVLPGTITGFVPWRYFGLSSVDLDHLRPLQLAGFPILFIGGVILLICIWDFARKGKGTLAPVDPPKHLVVEGLYRYVRNPMYVGVFWILFGELLLVWTTAFLGYLILFAVAVNVFVMGYEEPTLRRLFGPEYDEYCRRVGRWIPRWRVR
ncbi:MAG TPA: isoprenylcysteine carboxylmethyltransferase family protein [Gemmatimonadales bacterium]|nr:isoprenylcysteine carboxylmethyltransferase family protein [Gemmatimonadales bacterium]